MNNPEFKYEVAFSYMKEDESIVRELNDQFHGQFETFIYTQRQQVLGGTDGMESFPQVFGKDARIVVIMYREVWGKETWTRVEEQAIKERAFDNGSDFIVLVNLDRGKPKWYNGTRIRVLLKEYGMIEAAAIIRQRVEDSGGQVREESVLDLAERNAHELQRQFAFTQYYSSAKAVADACDEFGILCSKYEDTMKQLEQSGYHFGQSRMPGQQLMYQAMGIALCFEWKHEYSNTLNHSGLKATIENTVRFDRYRSPRDKVVNYETGSYALSLNRNGERCWSDTKDSNLEFTTEALLKHWIKSFLNRVHELHMKAQKKQLQS